MTSSLVKAAPPSEGLKHPQNGAAARYLEEPPGVGSTRGEGSLVRDRQGQLHPLSGSAAWAICKERGRKAGIQPPAPHDLRRTWTGDLLEAGVDLATVQKMAGHASVSTTGRYDRRDHGVQRRAVALLTVPYSRRED
jgi:site-specific recombinase XerD